MEGGGGYYIILTSGRTQFCFQLLGQSFECVHAITGVAGHVGRMILSRLWNDTDYG
jgi:hypothetical protein